MRQTSALAARLTETVTNALSRAAERLLGPFMPQPQARLVPVRVRRHPPADRR